MKFVAACDRCRWSEEYHGSAASAGRMVLRAAFAHTRTALHRHGPSPAVQAGSGNIFKDLGFSDAEAARLLRRSDRLITREKGRKKKR